MSATILAFPRKAAFPDIAFEDMIWRMCIKHFPKWFELSDNPPTSLAELNRIMPQRMVVWDGGSDHTIFEDRRTNFAFRAWHDWHHWNNQAEFDQEGELACTISQAKELLTDYGDTQQTRKWIEYVACEIMGQLWYSQRHNGQFPVDQRAFALAFLDNPSAAVTSDY
jgi:hypothetical protein